HGLVDPGTQLPQFITGLTGITQADLAGAPLFMAIADELQEVLDGAIFVAHNVRFDYSFLKQEFKRVGKEFRPRQLCTLRLSRTLFPQHSTHKLQDLIRRHNLQVAERHRAYADAHALWQFLQCLQRDLQADLLEQAIAKQLKKPSLPKGLPPNALANLPESSGVYIFEDEAGRPIYIGKSINIRQRVSSHFMHDHDKVNEFKIAQHVRNISIHQTASELQALLLESRLVKELQPLYNKRLRKTEKLLLAKQEINNAGYFTVVLEEASAISPEDAPDILAIYTRRSKAKASLEQLAKDWQLCPKLCGLEKGNGACFWSQLRRCNGACIEKEAADAYNERLRTAFANVRIEHWPYSGPVLVQPRSEVAPAHGIILDQWCVIAEVKQEAYCEPTVTQYPRSFDLDTYKILQSHLKTNKRGLTVRPISLEALRTLT
ncbi:MAG: exonuclease domain-containing protein, partial [Patescibacteria group bacterium]